MLFADDIVICEETREKVEQRLECWRYALERRGMKVSRSKTEYHCANRGNDKEIVKMEDTKVPRVKEFKYLGSTMQENGNCEREVKRIKGWRKVSGIICDMRIPARAKEKVYSSAVRPVMVGRNAISFLYNGNIDHLIHVHLTVLNFFFLVF